MLQIKINVVLLCQCFFLVFILPANAQQVNTSVDPAYIQSYDTMLTTRVFLSQKYLSLQVKDKNQRPALKYYPNSKANLGIGASYGWFTINVAAGFGFMNNDKREQEKGKTKALDLQAHFYGPKMIVDLYNQFYKGYYLSPKGTAGIDLSHWYTRPDINMLQLGGAVYYVVNWKKFSYRAAYLQNEWQTKSAGSFLLGAELFYNQVKGDSALVPAVVNNGYKAAGVYRIQTGDIGPGAGYAYTLVVAKHFFVSGALTGNLSVNLVKETARESSENTIRLNPNYAFKTGIGYNSRKFTTSITWVNNSALAGGSFANYTSYAGNIRYHLAYRFGVSKAFKQKFRFLQGGLL